MLVEPLAAVRPVRSAAGEAPCLRNAKADGRKPVTELPAGVTKIAAAATVRFHIAATVKRTGRLLPGRLEELALLSLSPEPTQTLPGRTYYSDSTLGPWPKPTGVYLPPGTDTDTGFVDMLIYLHGHLVPNLDQLFNLDGVAVRRQVLASGKSLVLAAPWLGLGGGGTTYKTSDITGAWGDSFINSVLNALVPPAIPKPDLYNTALIPRLHLRNLVIACHSGGGTGMRNLVGALGRYKRNLKACWGFDCLYGINNEDANFWYDWSKSSGCPLYISYGSSTIHESVKLYLMKEGIVTKRGARSNPEGPTVDSIDVEIGIPTGKYIDDVMGLDKLLLSTTPKPGQPQSQSSDFLDQVIANVRRNAGWPTAKDAAWAMHYRIAREGLLSQLKAATYL